MSRFYEWNKNKEKFLFRLPVYLDSNYGDHIEVFDKFGNFRGILNLDGTLNADKTVKVKGRKLE